MLKQGNCVKLFTAETSGELECRAGESLLIKRIETFTEGSDTDIVLRTDRVTVGNYRVQGKSCGHLDTIRAEHHKFNLMEFLSAKRVNVALPVAEGETFSWIATAAIDAVIIIFDRYDAGDILKTQPNGSASKEYVFMQYMNIGTALTATGNALFDTSLSPGEFPDFPCGDVVPARTRITLLGLIGCPWCDGQEVDKGFYTTAIKIVRGREVMFDEDRIGLPFHSQYTSIDVTRWGADYTVIGAGHHSVMQSQDPAGEPLMFDPPMEFAAGDELNIYAACTAFGDTPGWTSTVPDLAAILKVVRE